MENNLIGRIFGRWNVVEKANKNKYNKQLWECVCSCKNKTKRNVLEYNLINGSSKSCGCIAREKIKEYNKEQRGENTFFEQDDYIIGIDSNGSQYYFDIIDLEKIKSINRTWRVAIEREEPYVICSLNGKEIKMHNFILDTPKGLLTDHIDGVHYDNRRKNLRIVDSYRNAQNRKIPSNNSSGVKGVNWHYKTEKWCSRIGYNGKRILLGYFENFEDAVDARKEAEEKYYGEYNRKPSCN